MATNHTHCCSTERNNFWSMTSSDKEDWTFDPCRFPCSLGLERAQPGAVTPAGKLFCLQPPICMNVSTGILSVICVSFMSEFYSQNKVYCLRHTEELATSARYPLWIPFQILLRKDLLRSFFHYSTASLKPHLRIRDHQNFTNDQLLLLMKVYDQNM